MTRTECEASILRKMIEIEKIYKEYNPSGNYLTMSVFDGHYSVNNDYNANDIECPLYAWFRPDEYDQPYSYFDLSARTHFDLETGEVTKNAP